MRLIIIYLLAFLASISTGWILYLKSAPMWLNNIELLLNCIMIGGIGGVLYCLRAVYINACVKKSWDEVWYPWYFIRPFVSLISGGISFLFLKAGLIILEAGKNTDSSNLGFLAFAFISGYNVDKFLDKLEKIAGVTWGIGKPGEKNQKEQS